MEIYVDDHVVSPATTMGTLADVLTEAKNLAARNDRVIASFVCDGLDVSDGDMDAALAGSTDCIGRVDFTTARPEVLVADALTQALGLLEETDEKRQQVVELLTRGEDAEANDGLVFCFQNWSRIHTAVIQALAMLDMDAATLQVNGEGIETVLAEITNQLQQVREVLMAGDKVLLADLLQYEFEQATNRWQGAIEAILARTSSPATG